MPTISATRGSSCSRWTVRAPHQRATPVTRMRRLLTIVLCSLDDVALHRADRLANGLRERPGLLAQRPLELAQERVEALHRLDGIADVDVRRQRDGVQRLARGPAVGEVD